MSEFYLKEFGKLIETKDLGRLIELICNQPSLLEIDFGGGSSALHYACDCNFLELVDYLVIEAKMDVNHKDDTGDTPLYLPSAEGNLPMVEKLLSLNANSDGCKTVWDSGFIDEPTPLSGAVMSGHFDTVKVLLSNNASTNVRLGKWYLVDLAQPFPKLYNYLMNRRDILKGVTRSEDIEKSIDVAEFYSIDWFNGEIAKFFIDEKNAKANHKRIKEIHDSSLPLSLRKQKILEFLESVSSSI